MIRIGGIPANLAAHRFHENHVTRWDATMVHTGKRCSVADDAIVQGLVRGSPILAGLPRVSSASWIHAGEDTQVVRARRRFFS